MVKTRIWQIQLSIKWKIKFCKHFQRKKKDGLFNLKGGCQLLHDFAALPNPTSLFYPAYLLGGVCLFVCFK